MWRETDASFCTSMLTARYIERLRAAPRFVSRQLFGGARIENVGQPWASIAFNSWAEPATLMLAAGP